MMLGGGIVGSWQSKKDEIKEDKHKPGMGVVAKSLSPQLS